MTEELKSLAPALAAVKANNLSGGARGVAEWVNGLQPGEFDKAMPAPIAAVMLENARTLHLQSSSKPSPPLACAHLAPIYSPTTDAKGMQTRPYFELIADAVARCIPGSKTILFPEATHAARVQNPQGFNEAVLSFMRNQ